MTALPGELKDYVQGEDGGWSHPDYPVVHYVTEGEKYTDFADFYAKRAVDTGEVVDVTTARLAELEQRLVKVEEATKAVEVPI